MCDCTHPQLFDSAIIAARKPHVCCECGREIPKGSQHYWCHGKWDGEFETFRRCLDCHRLCERLSDVDCICFGGLLDEVNEAYRWQAGDDAECWQRGCDPPAWVGEMFSGSEVTF